MTGKGEELYTTLNTLLQDYVFNEAYAAGNTAYVAGDYETAITYYESALEANPSSTDALYYLGYAYYNTGDYTNSDRCFKELIQRDPTRAAEVQGYIQNQSTESETGETDENGNPVQETNADGTPVQETNADGTPVQETNADGTSTGETDSTQGESTSTESAGTSSGAGDNGIEVIQ